MGVNGVGEGGRSLTVTYDPSGAKAREAGEQRAAETEAKIKDAAAVRASQAATERAMAETRKKIENPVGLFGKAAAPNNNSKGIDIMA